MPTSVVDKDDLVGLDSLLVHVIKDITDSFDKEDRNERDVQRQLWMKLERYFEGHQRLFWDTMARDWKSVDRNETARHYDKIINIYRAHAESIIAALSIKPPSAIFYPEDADVEEDVTTAKACVKIKENLERINNAQMNLIKALAILFNQGTCAAYIYNRKNSAYGVYEVPEYGDAVKYYSVLHNCAECGSNIDEIQFKGERGKVEEETKVCAVCGYEGLPEVNEYEEEFPEIIGVTSTPKSRTFIEVFSPLFVYLPFYARKQEGIPYLRLRFEQHYSALKNVFPKLKKKGFSPSIDQVNADERGIRIGVNDSNLCTVDCWWIRPWGFDIIDGKDKEIKKLKEKFPDGMYVIIIDDQIVEVTNESLDDHWAISSNPLSTYIHGEPLGKGLAPIQDLENEILDLQIETFEYSIPETFARSDVLDFKKYKNSKSQPGMIYPAIPPAEGMSLADAFHSVKTATLSEEADAFMRRLDDKAQFVSSAFPSIYGGPAISGSKTAREYTESRSMALQRLSLPWNVLKYWWADVMSKAVPLYIHAIRESGEDEKIVEKTNVGFVNTWIKQGELEGKIGTVEADADENLPLTPGQLKDVIMALFTMKDDFISDAMAHPNNTPLITKALGAPDFYIPNSDERNKQYGEFADLLQGVPVEVKEYEKHEVAIEVCSSFLVSPTGIMLRKQNPQGIEMIEQHMQEHLSFVQTEKPTAENPQTPVKLPPEEIPGSLGDNIMPFPPRVAPPVG